MNPLEINPEEYQKFKSNPDQGPIIMLNLLKFKPGGEESYARYAKATGKIVMAIGGRVLYAGRAAELLTGQEQWDAVLLVQYPSRKVFLEMINDNEYQKIHKNREAALERAVLYTTTPADLRKQ